MGQKEYSRYTNYQDAEDFKRLDFIVNSVNDLKKKDAYILDIGCGNGNISLALGALGYNVLGIDIDATSIRNATALNMFDNVRFEISDANTFSINDNFDAVICSEVLEHLDRPWELVKSIYRILNPGGLLVATVPNGQGPREVLVTRPMLWLHDKDLAKPVESLKRLLGYSNTTLQSANEDLTHTQFFSVKSFQKLIENAGFVPKYWGSSNFISRIFPYSILTRKIYMLQKLDCDMADFMPKQLASGFFTTWNKPA